MEIGEEISGDEEIRDLPAWKVENSNPEVSFGNSLTAKNSKHLTMFFKVKMNTEGGKKKTKQNPTNHPNRTHIKPVSGFIDCYRVFKVLILLSFCKCLFLNMFIQMEKQ